MTNKGRIPLRSPHYRNYLCQNSTFFLKAYGLTRRHASTLTASDLRPYKGTLPIGFGAKLFAKVQAHELRRLKELRRLLVRERSRPLSSLGGRDALHAKMRPRTRSRFQARCGPIGFRKKLSATTEHPA